MIKATSCGCPTAVPMRVNGGVSGAAGGGGGGASATGHRRRRRGRPPRRGKERPFAGGGQQINRDSPKRIPTGRRHARIWLFPGHRVLFRALTGAVRLISEEAGASGRLANGSIQGKKGHRPNHVSATCHHLLTCHCPDTSICTRIRGVSVPVSNLPADCGTCTTSWSIKRNGIPVSNS